jgi:hypothetical protein
MSSTHQDPMQALLPAISAFRRIRGFELSHMMATLRPLMLPTSPRGEILRAIQCEKDGTYALVRLYGPKELEWVSRYRRALIDAGYTEKSSLPGDNEVALTRWISDRRTLAREMGLLARLKRERELPCRPEKPQPTRLRRRSFREWNALFRAVQEAQLPIVLCTVSFSRAGALRGDRKGAINVDAVAIHDVGHPPNIHIMVSMSSSSVAAMNVIRVLETSGYERSKYSDSVTQILKSVPLAVRECERVFRTFAR